MLVTTFEWLLRCSRYLHIHGLYLDAVHSNLTMLIYYKNLDHANLPQEP